jgi:hypothetical protein
MLRNPLLTVGDDGIFMPPGSLPCRKQHLPLAAVAKQEQLCGFDRVRFAVKAGD